MVDELLILNKLGWSEHFQKMFEAYSEKGYIPGRIVTAYMHKYSVCTEYGELTGEISGKVKRALVKYLMI